MSFVSEDLENRLGDPSASALADTTRRAAELTSTQLIVRECGNLGYSLDRIADYVKACIYEGFSPTSEGAVRSDLNISHELFKACTDLLDKQGLITYDPSLGKYSWTWNGLFSRNQDWSWSTFWRIGIVYALADKDIPGDITPPNKYRSNT
ncbi:hypothetical protein HY493_04355 [Candidatus Woesearchaeota archaeon]|nr:hypothetical protein [Candidatus Woesearchaeota archaeon]